VLDESIVMLNPTTAAAAAAIVIITVPYPVYY
jgi:hypothetical protein